MPQTSKPRHRPCGPLAHPLDPSQAKQEEKEKENDEFAAALAEAGVVFADDYTPEDKKVNFSIRNLYFCHISAT